VTRDDVVGRAFHNLKQGQSFIQIAVGPKGEVDVAFWNDEAKGVELGDLLICALRALRATAEQANELAGEKPRIIIPDFSMKQ
jgi:hypothetical protein